MSKQVQLSQKKLLDRLYKQFGTQRLTTVFQNTLARQGVLAILIHCGQAYVVPAQRLYKRLFNGMLYIFVNEMHPTVAR